MSIRTILSTMVVSLATVGAADAQVHDHLQCFKVKDTVNFAATVDLRPADEPPFAVDADCRVKVRSRQLCIPVEKDLVEATGPQLGVGGQELLNAFLCYSVKCRDTDVPAAVQMSDQFGSRTLTGLRTTTVCAPAVYGVPATTTTTTIPAGIPRECADATPPACDGHCGDQNFACLENAGACVCQGVDVFLPCGAIAGAPNCLGSCDGTHSCLDVAGACQCGFAFE
jgi:hypothetical protein